MHDPNDKCDADAVIAENTYTVDETGNIEQGTLDDVYGDAWSLDCCSQN
jgi:hypothetical protein